MAGLIVDTLSSNGRRGSGVTGSEEMLRIKAQVMVVDEQTALWRLHKPDPLSVVTVRRSQANNSYHITACSVNDTMNPNSAPSDPAADPSPPRRPDKPLALSSTEVRMYGSNSSSTALSKRRRPPPPGGSLPNQRIEEDIPPETPPRPASRSNTPPQPTLAINKSTNHRALISSLHIPDTESSRESLSHSCGGASLTSVSVDVPSSLVATTTDEENEPSPQLPPRRGSGGSGSTKNPPTMRAIQSRPLQTNASHRMHDHRSNVHQANGIRSRPSTLPTSRNHCHPTSLFSTHTTTTTSAATSAHSATKSIVTSNLTNRPTLSISSNVGDWDGTQPTINSSRVIPREYGDYRNEYKEFNTTSASAAPASTDEGSTLSSYYKKSHYDQPPLPTRRRKSRLLCCFRRNNGRKTAASRGPRLQCQQCDQFYYEKDNSRGACPVTHTTSDSIVDCCTCSPVLNSCLRRYSNDYTNSPQSNSTSTSRRSKRRALLVLLTIILPCIWCYTPCHHCLSHGKQNGCWGARHTPTMPKSDSEASVSL